MFLEIPLCIRMLKNKAQIAQESIKKTQVADLEGGATGTPQQNDQLCFLKSHFVSECFIRNKAQIAQESIKKTQELPRPLAGPGLRPHRTLLFALEMCVCAHNLLHPPPSENPGSAPAVSTT